MQSYLTAAVRFAELVAAIPHDAFDGPGLGEWDLRALVGHTSRAMVTVQTYLAAPEPAEATLASALDYYRVALGGSTYPGEVADRGRRAGLDLGPDPAATIADQLMRLARTLHHTDPARLVATPFGAIALVDYVRTRSFELVVHGQDIARVTGLPFPLPDDVMLDAVTLAGALAVQQGAGAHVLSALTGREPLETAFTVL